MKSYGKNRTVKFLNIALARKLICALSLISLMIFALPALDNNLSAALAEGKAEMVMELSTGGVLHAKNADARMPMASTTKVMTALIVIEDCDLDEEITVPDEAVGVEGSSIYLKHGERITVRDLVYGLMLRSGNDSAAALAIHHSGNIKDFVNKMNERAAEMGLKDTNFTNPSGLPDENHYTTARELCQIACEAMKNPTFKKVVSAKSYSGDYRNFMNKNKMLSSLDGANGVKTGYTQKAGRCLISSAERKGMDVVCVVLNCPDMYERSSELINSCFNAYELKKIDENKVFMSGIVPCKLKNASEILVKKDAQLRYEVIPDKQKGKIRYGDEVGTLKIYSENNLIFCGILYSIINE